MIHHIHNISVFDPSGELDYQDGRKILDQIGNLVKCDWNKIVLDLRQVDHIHYRFLSELQAVANFCSHASGGIKLANLSPYTKDILKITGVDRYFETYDSVADAVLSFQSSMSLQ